jgi:hypothetical protein
MKAQPKSKAVLFSPWFILFISSSDHLHFPQGNDYSLFALISANSILLETFLWVVWFNPSNPQSPFKIKPLVHRASSSWEVIFQCDFFSWDVQCAYAELQKVSQNLHVFMDKFEVIWEICTERRIEAQVLPDLVEF